MSSHRGISQIIGIMTLTILLNAPWAAANGGFKSAPAYPAAPTIPVQRAMIVHQDGIETLVVESSFDTPSPDVGWILPLPAEPTSLQAGESGMLQTLSGAIQPRITGGLASFAGSTRVLLLASLIWVAIAIVLPRSRLAVYLGIVLTLLAASILLPTLNAPRGFIGGDGIDITSTQRIGSYDATVLRAGDAGALSRWLADQKLAGLEPSEQAIIDDYIARGWCFVVARLVRDEGGMATPHPLVATFPAENPVFPMKLTAIGQSQTRIELIVVADQQAAAEGFACVAADTFRKLPGDQSGDRQTGPTLTADTIRIDLGHPDAVDRMWDRCVITKLQADLSPQQMDRDVEMTLSPVKPQRQHFYAEQARRDLFVGILQLGGLFIALITGVALRGGKKPDRLFVNTVGVFLVLTFASAAIARAVLPVIPTEERSWREVIFGRQLPQYQLRIAESLVQSDQLHAGTTEQDLQALLPKFKEELADRFESIDLKIERSPGNLALRKIDGETWLCAYDSNGEEHRLRLPPRQSAPQAERLNETPDAE